MTEPLHPSLRFNPIPHGDPPPDPWWILRDLLDKDRQVELVRIVIEQHLAIAQAHVATLEKLQSLAIEGR